MELITLQESCILSNPHNLVNIWELPGSDFCVDPEILPDLMFKNPILQGDVVHWWKG